MAKQNITKQKLLESIESFQNYLKNYHNDKNLQNELLKHKATLNNRKYQVAVVANMSSGKSTFINALFGADVLPTSTKATTDCATYIHPFAREKYAEVYFDNKNSIRLNEKELGELQEYAKKDEDCKDSRYHNVANIHLYYPFRNFDIKNKIDFEIIFVDTPGPNSNGGDYADKHKTATKAVLQQANLVLFLLDYTQLDASLCEKKDDGGNNQEDKQGLWHTIEDRKSKDGEKFDVFFVVNKIDIAFAENLTQADKKLNIEKAKSNISKAEEEKLYAEILNGLLGTHEREAIEKVEKVAKRHLKNDNVRVFGVSSQIHLYRVKGDALGRTERRNYNEFKEHFVEIYGDKAEEKLIECIGFETLMKAIEDFLCETAIQSVMQGISNDLLNKVNERKEELKQVLATLDKPESEAKYNIKKAKDFLEKAAPTIQRNMQKEVAAIQKDAEDKILKECDCSLKACRDGIEYCVIKSMIFLHAYSEGYVEEAAKENANMLYKDEEARKHAMESKKIELYGGVKQEDVMEKLSKYTQELLGDIQRDFLDMQTYIRVVYSNLEQFNRQCFNKYKEELQKHIGENLNVEQQKLESLNTHIELPLDRDYIRGNVAHNIEEETKYYYVDKSAWYKPWTWFGDWRERRSYIVKKDYFEINPEQMKKELRDSMEDSVANQIEQAKKKHSDNIKEYCDANNKLFKEFVDKKWQELKKLESSLADTLDAKNKCKAEYDRLETLEKHIGE